MVELIVGLFLLITSHYILLIIIAIIIRGRSNKKTSSIVLQWLFENGFENIDNKRMFYRSFGTFFGKTLSGDKIRIFKSGSVNYGSNSYLAEDGSFVFQYTAQKPAPFTMSIVPKLLFRPKYGPFSNSENTIEFQNLQIYTQETEKVKDFVYQEEVFGALNSVRGILNNLIITGKQLSIEMAVIEARSNLLISLEALNVLIQSLQDIISDEARFENHYCYNCYSMLEFPGENCSTCKELSQRCVICWSDPDSFDSIIRYTCCRVYAHKEHALDWQEKNEECPNCRRDDYHLEDMKSLTQSVSD
ncbi:MAG: RING finger protein [Candidatus Hodarchaeales archaeon]